MLELWGDPVDEGWRSACPSRIAVRRVADFRHGDGAARCTAGDTAARATARVHRSARARVTASSTPRAHGAEVTMTKNVTYTAPQVNLGEGDSHA